MAQWKMQALSSSDGKLYPWLVSEPDFLGSSYPGPGTPLHIAIASRPAPPGTGVVGSPEFGSLQFADSTTLNGSELTAKLDDSTGLVTVSTLAATKATTSGGSPLTVWTLPLESNQVVSLSIRVVGLDFASNDKYIREWACVYRRQGAAAPTQWGTDNDVIKVKDDANFPIVAVSSNNVTIVVQGNALETWIHNVKVQWTVETY